MLQSAVTWQYAPIAGTLWLQKNAPSVGHQWNQKQNFAHDADSLVKESYVRNAALWMHAISAGIAMLL